MSQGIALLRFPVKDLTAAKKLYTQLLGVEPYVDQPYYVGFRLGKLEVGLDPNGHKGGLTAPIGYWQVDDIRNSLQLLAKAGAQVVEDVKDVGAGKLVATVKDASGNVTGLIQTP